MDTRVRTPNDVFIVPQRLLVPLFQRPYVWNEENQWRLLWDDVRRHADLHLATPGANGSHFLGAVVLQHDHSGGLLPQRTIIDGQQRLTTLQLLLDATHAALTDAGQDTAAGFIDDLTANADKYTTSPEDRFKVWPTNRDRAAYNEVMAAAVPVDYESLEHRSSLIVQAHSYFAGAVGAWLAAGGAEAIQGRAMQIVKTLTTGIQLVVIELEATEDSQEIFETLNARGTPLTAADLIKNLIFQKLAQDGVDTEEAYREHWRLFETPFWETEISVGRYNVQRSSLFLNQWLMSRIGEEISPRATFTRYKHFIEHETKLSVLELLRVLHQQALVYQGWINEAASRDGDLSAVGMAVYRTQAAGLELLKPALLWLHEPGLDIPAASRDVAVRSIESWLIRRSVLRLTSSDLGRVVADLIRVHRPAPPAEVGQLTTAYLARLDRMSTYWPGDAEVRTTLFELAAYRRYPRGRLRMLLEAGEDYLRGYANGSHAFAHARVRRGTLTIEHLIPQRWRQNWPVGDVAAEIERDGHVQRLGNLTLLTGPLNSAVSNGAWLGTGGKWSSLEQHDVLLLNREIRKAGTSGWDEVRIDARAADLVDAILQTWPVPEGHEGPVNDRTAAEPSWVEVKDLVAAGLLTAGQVLRPREGAYSGVEAVVQPDGSMRLDGRDFTSPSGAGHHVVRHGINGWFFWYLEDGRRLADLREQLRSAKLAE